MNEQIDLDAYFQRISYTGPRTATLEVLHSLHALHTETIPFENLSPLMRRPVPLDIDWLVQKLVLDGRGGYCFEQNLLFGHVLRALGFTVIGLAARVLWAGVESPRTHMLLRVEIDKMVYFADVGFGGQTLTTPLRFELDVEQATTLEPFRIIRREELFEMQSKNCGEWKPLYQFDMQRQRLVDYEVSNWYVSTCPESMFVSNLIAARPASDCRYALRNNHLSIHHLGGETEKRTLTSVSDLQKTLESDFLLALPQTPDLEAVFQRVINHANIIVTS